MRFRLDRAWVAAFILTALALPARPAAAKWPRDPFNGNVALCTAAGAQNTPMVASDGAGGAIVTWSDHRGASYDIYVQMVNAAGVPQWTPNGVLLCSASGDQTAPMIVSDGAGGAIVTWQDLRAGTGFYDAYAQRVSSAGTPLWTTDGVVVSNAMNHQNFPMLVSDGLGGAIITWQDSRSGNFDIYVQRLDAAGTPQWTTNGVALCVIANPQNYPTIATDGAGGAIVTWEDGRAGVTAYDTYAQRVSVAGVPQWTANGVTVCNATDVQGPPTIVSDGVGGAIVTWHDLRAGPASNGDIYAQRLSAAGIPQWTANGVAVCATTNGQTTPMIVSDGSSGAIITWEELAAGAYDVYAQRVSSAGIVQWGVNAVPLCTAPGNQPTPTLVSDGSGGAIVTWHDIRSGNNHIYAQRVSAAGVPLWAANGAVLCTSAGDQLDPTLVTDGRGGAIVTWSDSRSGNSDIYAQRIETYGQLGNPEPSIVSARDIPNDQGGFVHLIWNASDLDGAPDYTIGSYNVWRNLTESAAQLALKHGSRVIGGSSESIRGERILRATPAGTHTQYWEFVGSVPARGYSGYSFPAPTLGDSTPDIQPFTVFMVDAQIRSGYAFWSSAADSGYSVDNLPPAMPAPFTGEYGASETRLHWNPNREADLEGYRLYRGSSTSFIPGPSNRIAAPRDTGYVDPAGTPYVYKLTAVDVHGNESPSATLVPSGTSSVPDPPATWTLDLVPPAPNPVRGNSGVLLVFGLPRDARVMLALYDAQGRTVRRVVDGDLPAGPHRVQWDGRDASGRRVGPGLYLARLESGRERRQARIVVLE